MKNKLVLSIVLMAMVVTNVLPVFASDEKKKGAYEETVTYEAENEKEEKSFPQTKEVGNIKYKLRNVTYEVVSKNPVQKREKVSITQKSEPMVKGSEHSFEQIVEKDGITYTLDTIKEQLEPYKQEVTTSAIYEYAVSDVPQKKTVTVKNEKTGQDVSVTCDLQNISQTGSKWVDSYIDVTFQQYNANVFNWQGVKITKNSQTVPLKGYESQLLKSVGLSNATGEVLKTYWTSDEYTENGIVCRDARADIRKQVPVYTAMYEGVIEEEMVVQEAVYTGDRITESDTEFTYTIKATATYEKNMTVVYVSAAIGILLLAVLIVLIFYVISKEKKKEEEV